MAEVKRDLFGSVWVLMVTGFLVLAVLSPCFAEYTAYWSFDTSFEPDYALEQGLSLQMQRGADGAHVIDRFGGQPGFGGALHSVPDAASCYWGSDCTKTFNSTEGTIEFWVSPAWNGTNQGGQGVGGVGSCTELVLISGYPWQQGLQIMIYNTNYPDDGGQLIAYWQDRLGNNAVLDTNSGEGVGYPHGSTKDWTAGSWHHVAFCWDETTLGLYLDGQAVCSKPRPSPEDGFGLGLWLGGHTPDSVAGVGTLDGWLDDLVIHNVARYKGSYDVPAKPWPEPTTVVLVGLGGLTVLRRKHGD